MLTWLSPSSLPKPLGPILHRIVFRRDYVSLNPFLSPCDFHTMAVFAAESSRLGLQPLDIEEHLESYHLLMSNELSMRWS